MNDSDDRDNQNLDCDEELREERDDIIAEILDEDDGYSHVDDNNADDEDDEEEEDLSHSEIEDDAMYGKRMNPKRKKWVKQDCTDMLLNQYQDIVQDQKQIDQNINARPLTIGSSPPDCSPVRVEADNQNPIAIYSNNYEDENDDFDR